MFLDWNVPVDAARHTVNASDAEAAMTAAGQVAYRWTLGTDALQLSGNAADVLQLGPQNANTGRAFAQLVDPNTERTRYDAVTKAPATDDGAGVPYHLEYCFRPAPESDVRLWIEDSGRWYAGADGRPEHALGVMRVINERHAREQQLAFLAECDGLTGELNRWHLCETMLSVLDSAIKQRGSCGFLLVCIDNLSWLNEGYGYGVGDEVISAVAKRLRSQMRGEDSLGRYSGNKFGIVLRRCLPDELTTAAERMIAAVRDEMVTTSCGPIAVSVSVGGVTAPRHAQTVEEIFARAQEGLDSTKERRRGSYMAYRPDPEREALRRGSVQMADAIVAALNARNIAIAFEPVAEAATRLPIFQECLLRAHYPDGAPMPTQHLVEVAEKLGLIRLLDHRVLELAVAELNDDRDLRLSVNVSPASVVDPDWGAALGAFLRAHVDAAQRLTLEITETTAIRNVDDMRGFVCRVKDLGCSIAIDDFGAGHTSFRNLRKLGVDLVKIDGSFVQNMVKSPDDRAFVQTLVDLARRLGLGTVAEWVRDEETASLLTQWGCDFLQGELIGSAVLRQPRGEAETSPLRISA